MKHRNFSRIKTHTVRGKRYKIRWRRPQPCPTKGQLPGEFDGHCDPPDHREKVMYIYAGGDAINLVGTIGHELFHASNFDMDEGLVDEWEESFTKMLRRMKARITFDE